MYPGLFSHLPEGRKWSQFRLLGLTLFFHLSWVLKTQPAEPSAVHMPFKVVPDSTYHHTKLKPYTTLIHTLQSALHTAEVVCKGNMFFIWPSNLSFSQIQPAFYTKATRLYLWYVESSLGIKWCSPPFPPLSLWWRALLSIGAGRSCPQTTDPESEIPLLVVQAWPFGEFEPDPGLAAAGNVCLSQSYGG